MIEHSLIVACIAGAFEKSHIEFLYDSLRASSAFIEITKPYARDETFPYDDDYSSNLEELRDGFIIQMEHREFSKIRFDIQAASRAMPSLALYRVFSDHGGDRSHDSYLDGEEITFRPRKSNDRDGELDPIEALDDLRDYARRTLSDPSPPQIQTKDAYGLESQYPGTQIRYRRHWNSYAEYFGEVRVLAIDPPPKTYLNQPRRVPYTAGTMQTEDGKMLRFHCQYRNAIGSDSVDDAADIVAAFRSGTTLRVKAEIITTKSMPYEPQRYEFAQAFGVTRIMSDCGHYRNGNRKAIL